MSKLRFIIAALGLMAAAAAVAQPAGSGSQVLPPGIDMDEVEKRLGPPVSMKPPVGQPPITRWLYEEVTVYFEYDRVVHAVPNAANGSAR